MSHLHAGVIKDSTGSLDDGLIDRTVPGSSTHHFHVELFKHVIYCLVVGAGFEGGDLAIEAVIDTVQTFHNVPGTGQEVDSEAGLYLLGWVTNYGGLGGSFVMHRCSVEAHFINSSKAPSSYE